MCCNIGRYLLIIANIVFLLAGAALLGVGIAYRLDFDDITDVIPEEYNVDFAPTTLIVVGAIIFVIAFFGCCGAIKESRFMLLAYATVLVLLLIAQVAIGIVVLVRIKSDDDYSFKDAIHNETSTLFGKYSTSRDNNAIHVVQYSFECCGVDGPSYWKEVHNLANYPYSCCGKEEDEVCSVAKYENGCAETVAEFLEDASKVIGGVVIGIIVTEILGTLISCILSNRIKNKETV